MRNIIVFLLGFGLAWLIFTVTYSPEQQFQGPEGLIRHVKFSRDKEINELRKTVAEQAAMLKSKNATIDAMNERCKQAL